MSYNCKECGNTCDQPAMSKYYGIQKCPECGSIKLVKCHSDSKQHVQVKLYEEE